MTANQGFPLFFNLVCVIILVPVPANSEQEHNEYVMVR